MPYYVYMLASKLRGTLYTGVTDNLPRRMHEHKTGATGGFTRQYGVKILVYTEAHDDIAVAIAREKRINCWPWSCRCQNASMRTASGSARARR